MKNVFCLFHLEGSPYENHHEVPVEFRGVNIPLVVMSVRWDGRIGFPGGKVDPGETWEQALIRELKEEINFDADSSKFVFLGTFKDSSVWTYKLDGLEEVKKIIANSISSEHYLSETQGLFAVQLAKFKNGRGIEEFLKNNFAYTAKDELLFFMNKIGITNAA